LTNNEYDATESEEEYLEYIYRIEEIEKSPVKTTVIADELGFSAPAVSEMFKKLSSKGLVTLVPFKGVKLTEKGRKIAEWVISRHRLAERFLVDMLDFDWAKSHDEACKWEHIITEEVYEKMFIKLGKPRTCPHGNPIPYKNTEKIDTGKPLCEYKEGDVLIITRISRESYESLRHFKDLGLVPGVRIEIKWISPIDNSMVIDVKNKTISLSKNNTKIIWGKIKRREG